jgi:EmrB/QacA subfamily drug resistance transporter
MAETTGAPPRYRAIVLTACGGTFLAMLDSTVTSLAVPDLHRAFPAASVPDLSWVISGYAVMFAALLAPAGRLADALGRRRLFAFGVGLFTLASLLCALSPSLVTLVIARFIQGAGAAAMIPASLAILLMDGPAERRPQSIALWSTASAVAAALGPSIGGVLVEQFGWQSVFLINLPLGLIVIAATLRVVPAPAQQTRGALPDPIGTVLLAIGVGGLTLAVSEGVSWGWLDARTLIIAVAGFAALALAVVRSRTHPTPAIETSLWANKTFAATNITSLFYGMAQYAWMLGSVLYLTEIWDYSEMSAGVANTPGAFAASVAALGLSRISAKIGGPRTAVIGGLVAFVACGLWFTFGLIDHAAFLTFWLPAALLAGAGMGAATMGTSAAAAMSAPPTRFASSSGLNTTARQFGGALGIAMMAVVLQQSTGIDGTRDVDAYSNMFLYCTLMMIAALVVAVGWLKFPAAPTPAAAAPAQPVSESTKA